MFSLKRTFLLISVFLIIITANFTLAQDFWGQTSGPKDSGGDYEFLYTIAVDNSGIILAGSAGNGLYRSTDKGATWQHVINDFIIVWKIAVNSNGVIFACTDQEGIYRSTNSGVTWEKVFLDGSWITSISIDANDNIYICTESDGVYLSDDDGDSWTQIWNPGYVFWQIFVDNNGNLFTSTFGDGIFRSTDGGNNWDLLGFESDIIWQFAQGPDGKLWLGTDMDGLYESDDNGENWSPNGLNGVPISTILFDIKGTIIVSDYDMTVYRSFDNGASWESISSGLDWGINGTAVDENSLVYIASFGGGVYKSRESSYPAEFSAVSIVKDEFCQGEAFQVAFSVDGMFNEDNTFTLEISDVDGVFDNAAVIETIPGQGSGTFSNVYIPANLTSGTGYRIRVTSDTHPTVSPDNGTDITVNDIKVTLLEPADEATGVELTPELIWEAPASCSNTYSIEVSTNESFSNIIAAIVNHNGESVALTNPLNMLTDYWWRVGSETESGAIVYTTPAKFTTKGQSVFTHQINLAFGWNMMSTYISPDNLDMEVILQDIVNSVVIVKNNLGQVYIPMFEINDIGNWNLFEGYQVYMSQAEILEITGAKIAPESTPIPIKAGWNIISYIRDNQMLIETALASITDNNNLVIAKDNLGNVYFPEFGIDMIEFMKPGQAYQIYVLSNDNLQYPAN